MTNEERKNLGLVPKGDPHQARRDAAHALVLRRELPSPYTTIADLLECLEARIIAHPHGLAGVARELDCGRKNLWRWMRGMKVPDNSTLAKMGRVLAMPVPTVGTAIEVKQGVPIPVRGAYRFRASPRKSKWQFMATLKAGDYFEAAFADRPGIAVFATQHKIKITTRNISRDRIGVWIR